MSVLNSSKIKRVRFTIPAPFRRKRRWQPRAGDKKSGESESSKDPCSHDAYPCSRILVTPSALL